MINNDDNLRGGQRLMLYRRDCGDQFRPALLGIGTNNHGNLACHIFPWLLQSAAWPEPERTVLSESTWRRTAEPDARRILCPLFRSLKISFKIRQPSFIAFKLLSPWIRRYSILDTSVKLRPARCILILISVSISK